MLTTKNEIWGNFEKNLINSGITKIRRTKLKYMYNLSSKYIDLETAARQDIESFIDGLNSDEILKEDKEKYSGSTKSDIRKFLKQFYKWLRGNNEFYPPEVSWLKTKIAKDDKPLPKNILEKDQAYKLAQSFNKLDYKLATLLLFDGGFRIKELMSCNKMNLTFEPFDDSGNKCFWIECNESKTFTRKVPIFLFTEDLKSYAESMAFQIKQPTDKLLSINYFAYLTQLKKHSQKMFNLRITPHCLRHSSVTYYTKEYAGNVPLLAQRYGWSYSAKELQTYVRSSGAYNRQGAKISYQNDIIKLKEENDQLKTKLDILSKQISEIIVSKDNYINEMQKIREKIAGDMQHDVKNQKEMAIISSLVLNKLLHSKKIQKVLSETTRTAKQ